MSPSSRSTVPQSGQPKYVHGELVRNNQVSSANGVHDCSLWEALNDCVLSCRRAVLSGSFPEGIPLGILFLQGAGYPEIPSSNCHAAYIEYVMSNCSRLPQGVAQNLSEAWKWDTSPVAILTHFVTSLLRLP